MIKQLTAVVACALLLVGCQHISVTDSHHHGGSLTELANSIPDQQHCEEHGGSWQAVGRLQKLSCVLPTSDAGQACSSHSDCELQCIASKQLPMGMNTQGQCQSQTPLFGCRTEVDAGLTQATLCVD